MPGRATDRVTLREQLAIHGGQPVRATWLPYGHHEITEEDISAVAEVLRSDWITQGPKVEEFEDGVADYCGAKYGVACSSGTAALHAACVTCGLSPGDEVITTPLTFVATANSAVCCGAKPVFADIQADTLNIDPVHVERLITPKTKAILAVDFAGQPVDLDQIQSLADKHNLVVIEDACHALGAEYKGRKVGSISDMTVFSFHPVKHITTGEGGIVLTNDKSLAHQLKRLRHHGITYRDSQKPWHYEISELGFNYRLSDIHCALGLSQLRRLGAESTRRHRISERYRVAFSQLEQISLPSIHNDVRHAWHLFVVLLNLDKLKVDRDVILEALRAENIGATLHYPLVHLQPFYRKRFDCGAGTCKVAENIAPRLLTLPLYPAMMDQDVDDVIGAVQKVLKYYAS